MARVREAEGDLDAALDLLDEAERRYASDYFPNVRPIPAMRARVWIAQGRLDRAQALGPRAGRLGRGRPQLPARVRPHHARQAAPGQVRAGRCRSLGARGSRASWSASCRRRRQGSGRGASSRSWCCRRSTVEQRGDVAAALVPLERALTLAEPEGYVRIFVDEGAPMAALLESAARHGIAPTLRRPTAGGLRARPTNAAPGNRRWSSR